VNLKKIEIKVEFCLWILSATTSVRPLDDVEVLRPTNTIAIAGSSISLPCSSRADNDLRWDFYMYTARWDRPQTIYNGVSFARGRRINVDYDSCRLKTCHLSITPVQLKDSGYYICFEASRPKRIGVSLVVLGWIS